MFWDRKAETMSREELSKLQLALINKTISKAVKSPFYGELKKQGKIKKIKSLDEVKNLPFTEKSDLRNNFPYGLLALSLDKAVRMHSSSGTTGNPTVVFHTKKDLEDWAELLARSMHMAGLRPGHVFQNMMGYGLFTGGLGFHYGAERLGAMTIPSGTGNSKRQIWFLKTMRTTAVHILPSYALKLATVLEEENLKPEDLNLKMAFIGAEPHTEAMRQQIEKQFKIKAFNSYGLSELCGPGVAFECPYQTGMHLWEDHFYPEIINPETGEVLPDGEEGELVMTTLRRNAMPLLRYRTRDLTKIINEPCPCGRTHRRIARIKGRSDDMLIINGVNIFPMQIEKTIMGIPGVGSNYLIEIHKEDYMDRIHMKIEVDPEFFSGTLEGMEKLQKDISDALKTELLVTPRVYLLEPGGIPAAEGKAKRVADMRSSEQKLS